MSSGSERAISVFVTHITFHFSKVTKACREKRADGLGRFQFIEGLLWFKKGFGMLAERLRATRQFAVVLNLEQSN